ncbi:RadC family protein [Photorhabdus viridis]|uniref:RadC family protein n=1 Tax=Photorhabdus viridis TaxID=3163327 RepID=UPI003306C3B6
MSEINLPPDLPVTEARTIRRALQLLEKYQRTPGEKFNSTAFTKTWLQLRLALQEREVFLVLYLDNQNRLLVCETLFTGTINHTEVHPREVVKLALRHNAAAVILAHNHPSGETEPSKQDRNITQHLVKALAIVEVRVLDHLIVGKGDVLSFAERGWL